MCGVCCRQYDGVAVTVFERDERLGGRVRSVSIGGSEFEAGAAMAITQVCRCRRTAAAAHICAPAPRTQNRYVHELAVRTGLTPALCTERSLGIWDGQPRGGGRGGWAFTDWALALFTIHKNCFISFVAVFLCTLDN